MSDTPPTLGIAVAEVIKTRDGLVGVPSAPSQPAILVPPASVVDDSMLRATAAMLAKPDPLAPKVPRVALCYWWFENASGGIVKWCSWQQSWVDVPDDGFQARLICYDNGTFRRDSGADWYWESPHPSGVVYGSCQGSDAAEIAKRYPGAVIKRGKMVPDEVSHEIEAMMTAAQERVQREGCKGC